MTKFHEQDWTIASLESTVKAWLRDPLLARALLDHARPEASTPEHAATDSERLLCLAKHTFHVTQNPGSQIFALARLLG
jgi:hypothetical protein